MAKKNSPRLPKSFLDAISNRLWCKAIDREYLAFTKRNTWTCVARTPDIFIIPHTWVFRFKPLDPKENTLLHKARCVVRGDMQNLGLDLNPEELYEPVASRESIRMLLAISAHDGHIVEGGDVCNAYLYGGIDIPIHIEQPTNSTRIEEAPGYVCKLIKSTYGLKQAREIWGSLFVTTIIS